MNGYDAWKTTDRDAEEAEQRWLDEEREREFPPEYAYDEREPEDIRAKFASAANPLGFAAKAALMRYKAAQPFGDIMGDLTFKRGNAMVFFFEYLSMLRVAPIAGEDRPQQWKLTNLGWSVVLGPGLGTITPEADLPVPITELLALIAERGVRS